MVQAKMDIIDQKYKEASSKLQTLIRSMARYGENEDYMSREAQKYLAKAMREIKPDGWDDFLRRTRISRSIRESSDI